MDMIETIRRNTTAVLERLEEKGFRITRSIPERPFIIAIDGRCGSGKTTLAISLRNAIERRIPKPIITLIHMDDFYPRIEQRTDERYKTPGGNIDHERFSSEVLENLVSNSAFSYRPFDCFSMELSEPVSVRPSHVVIVEGSYSLHPALRDSYDLKIFMSITDDEQHSRILARNGKEKLRQFIERWIPLEELYFEGCKVRDCADMIIE